MMIKKQAEREGNDCDKIGGGNDHDKEGGDNDNDKGGEGNNNNKEVGGAQR